MAKLRVHFDKFIKIDSEEKAYWLGFIWADGNIYRPKKSGGPYLTVALQKGDTSHLEKLERFLGLKVKYRIRSGESNSVYLICKNANLCDQLENLGVVQNKTDSMGFVKVSSIPNNLIRHFIRGMIDGDGTIHLHEYPNRYMKYRIACCLIGSLPCSIFFKKYVRSLGLRYQSVIKGKVMDIRLDGLYSLFLIDKVYRNSKIYLDRKHNFVLENAKIMNSIIQRIRNIYDEAARCNGWNKERLLRYHNEEFLHRIFNVKF